jgi:hypothetical protein
MTTMHDPSPDAVVQMSPEGVHIRSYVLTLKEDPNVALMRTDVYPLPTDPELLNKFSRFMFDAASKFLREEKLASDEPEKVIPLLDQTKGAVH